MPSKSKSAPRAQRTAKKKPRYRVQLGNVRDSHYADRIVCVCYFVDDAQSICRLLNASLSRKGEVDDRTLPK